MLSSSPSSIANTVPVKRAAFLNRDDTARLAAGLRDHIAKTSGDRGLASAAARLITDHLFLPAGRTVAAFMAAAESEGIPPNCCVLPYNEMHTRELCLAQNTGIGTSLLRVKKNVPLERIVSLLNAQPHAQPDKRTAGLMHTLPWRDPRALQFIQLKRSAAALRDPILKNANHSLVVGPTEGDEFLRSELGLAAAKTAWACGEPGLLFSSRPDQATAPCGEVFMQPYEVCMLGNINLAELCSEGGFDAARAYEAGRIAAQVLDTLVDCVRVPSPCMMEMVRLKRRIGVGVVGFASALDCFEIRYGSEESLKAADFMGTTLERATAEQGRGRNASTMACPPTGGTAGMLGVSLSIEPHRHKELLATPEEHVRVLAAWQRHVDNGVSKTVTMPQSATVEDVLAVWRLAWRLRCKGVTVYRDGALSAECTAESCTI